MPRQPHSASPFSPRTSPGPGPGHLRGIRLPAGRPAVAGLWPHRAPCRRTGLSLYASLACKGRRGQGHGPGNRARGVGSPLTCVSAARCVVLQGLRGHLDAARVLVAVTTVTRSCPPLPEPLQRWGARHFPRWPAIGPLPWASSPVGPVTPASARICPSYRTSPHLPTGHPRPGSDPGHTARGTA